MKTKRERIESYLAVFAVMLLVGLCLFLAYKTRILSSNIDRVNRELFVCEGGQEKTSFKLANMEYALTLAGMTLPDVTIFKNGKQSMLSSKLSEKISLILIFSNHDCTGCLEKLASTLKKLKDVWPETNVIKISMNTIVSPGIWKILKRHKMDQEIYECQADNLSTFFEEIPILIAVNKSGIILKSHIPLIGDDSLTERFFVEVQKLL